MLTNEEIIFNLSNRLMQARKLLEKIAESNPMPDVADFLSED